MSCMAAVVYLTIGPRILTMPGRNTSDFLVCVSGGGGTHYHAWPQQSYDRRPSHPHNAGEGHVGLSPTTQTLLHCTKREGSRELFGDSREGRAASSTKNRL